MTFYFQVTRYHNINNVFPGLGKRTEQNQKTSFTIHVVNFLKEPVPGVSQKIDVHVSDAKKKVLKVSSSEPEVKNIKKYSYP
jgi:hypothetical protein